MRVKSKLETSPSKQALPSAEVKRSMTSSKRASPKKLSAYATEMQLGDRDFFYEVMQASLGLDSSGHAWRPPTKTYKSGGEWVSND